MEISEYQRRAQQTDQRPGGDEQSMVFPLLGLSSEVGSLVNQYKKRIRDGEAHALFTSRAEEELGDILWYVSNIATKLNISLDAIAETNLRRIEERWPSGGDDVPTRLLDHDFPVHEQLPRQAHVTFEERQEGDRPRVRISVDGSVVGDPLSDMAWEDDSYRFHDAFHFTYAAVLGWSPIVRSFLKRQRASDPRYREVEDSGRAKVIEEAIAALVFEYAREERFLDGVTTLEFSLLQTVASMASRFEVRVRTLREWERAILQSFEMWRHLRSHRGGTLVLDLERRNIDFIPPGVESAHRAPHDTTA